MFWNDIIRFRFFYKSNFLSDRKLIMVIFWRILKVFFWSIVVVKKYKNLFENYVNLMFFSC